jgi:hypothetical protein
MSGREGGDDCICPSRRQLQLQLQGKTPAVATATIQMAAVAAGEGGAAEPRRQLGGGGCLFASLSSLFMWQLAMVGESCSWAS